VTASGAKDTGRSADGLGVERVTTPLNPGGAVTETVQVVRPPAGITRLSGVTSRKDHSSAPIRKAGPAGYQIIDFPGFNHNSFDYFILVG